MASKKDEIEKFKRRYCAAKGICIPKNTKKEKKQLHLNDKIGQISLF